MADLFIPKLVALCATLLFTVDVDYLKAPMKFPLGWEVERCERVSELSGSLEPNKSSFLASLAMLSLTGGIYSYS